MADSEKSFPTFAEVNWWKLRNMFKQKVPTQVTASYLANAFTMQEDSARANLLNPLAKIGFVDESGKPGDLVYNWRDDAKYALVCQQLLEKIYPQEIRDLHHSKEADFDSVVSWFMNFSRTGEPAAKKYANLYMLLLRADPSENSERPTSKPKVATAKVQTQRPAPPAKKKTEDKPVEATNLAGSEAPKPPHHGGNRVPELHINIQLHISPESTPEQIDKIFESMSKHLKDFRS